jgi:hypothetical protein
MMVLLAVTCQGEQPLGIPDVCVVLVGELEGWPARGAREGTELRVGDRIG